MHVYHDVGGDLDTYVCMITEQKETENGSIRMSAYRYVCMYVLIAICWHTYRDMLAQKEEQEIVQAEAEKVKKVPPVQEVIGAKDAEKGNEL